MLRIGDRAPDFELVDLSGCPVRLTSILRDGAHVVLVFLRHMG